jgi:F-type H+-transporting ATPase subunit c
MKKLMFVLVSIFGALPAFAQEAAHAASAGLSDRAYYAIGAGIVLGLAALGGTMGQGKVGAAAMEGLARNPQAAKTMNTPMILSLVFIESLVILSFVIAIMTVGKIG